MIFSIVIVSCRNQINYAPVSSSSYVHHLNQGGGHDQQNVYLVKPRDTLYSIAFRYDKDFRKLAELNHIQSPYLLKAGQKLYLYIPIQKRLQNKDIYKNRFDKPLRKPALTSPQAVRKKVQISFSRKNTGSRPQSQVLKKSSHWIWPIQGRIVKAYAPNQNSKGIDIVGRRGDTIKASTQGVVAYAGNGLPGYGNLIIIKHEKNFLTAYSHNEINWVKEGQHVNAGQAIAKIGMIDRKFYGLHYEIRQSGHPVNPMHYLK